MRLRQPQELKVTIHTSLPILTVNRGFIEEFISAEPSCFALGLVEEGRRTSGFLALRPNEVIPSDVLGKGFRLGHGLLGTSKFEVVQFSFEFYGFGIYNVLINPKSFLVKTILALMVETKDYFFFALDGNQSVTAFRSDIGEKNLVGLKTNLPKIQNSTTTDTQYRKALLSFERNPEPAGVLLNWVCQSNTEYLDLSKNENRLEMKPT
ncbi:MAG: hypothetical protein OER04_10990 [Cyclobacteriaceae bacterium]|nr:hypothetical protein [Cyclobacteriaceae bacterium]